MRFLLSFPAIYSGFRRIFGGKEPVGISILREIIIQKAQQLNHTPFILDLGCGDGKIAKYLGNCCEYVGLDHSEKYIAFANKEYGEYGRFYTYDISQGEIPSELFNNGEPDVICMIGVIHHLADVEVDLIKKRLLNQYENAAFFSFDGVFLEKQNPIARILLRLDRGNHIRWKDGYQKLFGNYGSLIFHFDRIPYDFIMFFRHISLPQLMEEKFGRFKILSSTEWKGLK
ncbi:MAG: class I SAM-dependent methyltransferase [Nitrospinae bacterium]|nr:class I SAM-dependent methyltransferase [Nitrospinota bacterium]